MVIYRFVPFLLSLRVLITVSFTDFDLFYALFIFLFGFSSSLPLLCLFIIGGFSPMSGDHYLFILKGNALKCWLGGNLWRGGKV